MISKERLHAHLVKLFHLPTHKAPLLISYRPRRDTVLAATWPFHQLVRARTSLRELLEAREQELQKNLQDHAWGQIVLGSPPADTAMTPRAYLKLQFG